jgi:hypothetical protein
MTQRHGEEPVRVRTAGALQLPGDEAALIVAELVYRPGDPLAANLLLTGPDGAEVGWTFAWELLERGLVVPAGEGDLRVRPVPGPVPAVEIALSTSFAARIRLSAADIGSFVTAVRARAPYDDGEIAVDLDQELASIIASS